MDHFELVSEYKPTGDQCLCFWLLFSLEFVDGTGLNPLDDTRRTN